MRMRYWLIFGTLLGAASLANAKRPPAGWVMYRNKEMAVAISGLKNWKVINNANYIVFMHRARPIGTAVASLKMIPTEAQFRTLTSPQTLGALYQPGYHRRICDLDGVSAIQVEGVSRTSPASQQLQFFAEKNGLFYELTFSAPVRDGWEEYEEVFRVMLSSFKFAHS